MLTVVWNILKIIGIVLLCILGFILAVILLLLLVPFRYHADIKKGEQFTGKAAVSWLLHFLFFEVIYQGDVNLRLRILGIPVYDKLKKKERDEKKAAKKAQKAARRAERDAKKNDPEPVAENELSITETLKEEIGSENKSAELSATSEKESITVKAEDDAAKKEDDKKGKRKNGKIWWEFPQYFLEMLLDWLLKFLNFMMELPELLEGRAERLEQKILSLIDTIDYYMKLLEKKGSKWVIDFLKKEAVLLLKHIRPRGSKIDVSYANEDPGKVADMMGYYGMAMPFLPKHTTFNAQLGESKLEGTVKIKGRLFLCFILWHGLKIFFNKKVKIFFKLVKREAS